MQALYLYRRATVEEQTSWNTDSNQRADPTLALELTLTRVPLELEMFPSLYRAHSRPGIRRRRRHRRRR